MNELEELRYKRRSALIVVLTLGLAYVPMKIVLQNNIFEGSSLFSGNHGAEIIGKMLSTIILTGLIAIPAFIIFFFKLIYYSIRISKLT